LKSRTRARHAQRELTGENKSSGGRLRKIYDARDDARFCCDALTFLGGPILSVDALGREREFRKQKDWVATIKEFKGVELTRRGIRLLDENLVELVFIRLSVTRSISGIIVVTSASLHFWRPDFSRHWRGMGQASGGRQTDPFLAHLTGVTGQPLRSKPAKAVPSP
jgi:hypothetical protein